MNKTAEYIMFEEGFLKEAAQTGCNEDFLRGYLDHADEIVNIWKEAFDELAEKSEDPLYKIKMANEIMYFSMTYPELLEKAAQGLPAQASQAPSEPGLLDRISQGTQSALGGFNKGTGMDDIQSKLQGWLGDKGISGWISEKLKENPNMLSSLIAGGGGGGLVGLLLGSLIKHPMLGMMLGGLGGAGVGAFLGNHNAQQQAMQAFSPSKPATPAPVKPPGPIQDPAMAPTKPAGPIQDAPPAPTKPIQPPVQKPVEPVTPPTTK
jgi:hypothetical protein